MRVLFVIHNFPPAHNAGSETYALHLAEHLLTSGEVEAVRVFTTDTRPGEPPYGVRRYTIGRVEVAEVNQLQDHRRFSESFNDPKIDDLFDAELRLFRPDAVHIHHLMHLSAGIVPRIPANVPRVMHLHDYWLSCPRGGQRLDEKGRICETVDLKKCAGCVAGLYADISVAGRTAERLEKYAADPYDAISPGGSLLRAAVRALAPKMPDGLGLPPKYLPSEVRADLELRESVLKGLCSAGIGGNIDRFIAPSEFLRGQLIRWGLPEKSVVYSDYGFTAAGAAGLATHEKGGVFTVGFVGTLSPHKGVHVLIDAFRSLQKSVRRPVALRVYGNRSHFPSYVAQLDRLSDGLPVEWAGAFDDSGRDAAYGALDVLVVPSIWWENSPLTIHEAFQRTLPVVVSDMGGMRELVADSRLRFKAGDSEALAGCLKALVTDEMIGRDTVRLAPKVKPMEADVRWTLNLYRELSAARQVH